MTVDQELRKHNTSLDKRLFAGEDRTGITEAAWVLLWFAAAACIPDSIVCITTGAIQRLAYSTSPLQAPALLGSKNKLHGYHARDFCKGMLT